MHFQMADLLCELISKVFDIKDVACCFALISPFFAICIKNAIAQQFRQGRVELGALQVVFKVACITSQQLHCYLPWIGAVPFNM